MFHIYTLLCIKASVEQLNMNVNVNETGGENEKVKGRSEALCDAVQVHLGKSSLSGFK